MNTNNDIPFQILSPENETDVVVDNEGYIVPINGYDDDYDQWSDIQADMVDDDFLTEELSQ